MAGSTGAGITHFKKVSGINGVYTGAAGSEVRLDEEQGLVLFTFGSASAAEVQVGISPVTGTVVGAYAVIGTLDINCVHTINHGSAGAAIGAVTNASPNVAAYSAAFTLSTAATALNVTMGEALTCTRSTTTSVGISQVAMIITKTA